MKDRERRSLEGAGGYQGSAEQVDDRVDPSARRDETGFHDVNDFIQRAESGCEDRHLAKWVDGYNTFGEDRLDPDERLEYDHLKGKDQLTGRQAIAFRKILEHNQQEFFQQMDAAGLPQERLEAAKERFSGATDGLLESKLVNDPATDLKVAEAESSGLDLLGRGGTPIRLSSLEDYIGWNVGRTGRSG